MPSALDLIGSNKALQDHWVRRFIAALIDVLIIFIPISIILGLAAAWLFGYGFGLAWPFLGGLISILYFVLLEASMGATFGKQLLNMRVTTLEGGQPDIGSLFIRNISRIYGLFFFLDWLIGFVMQGDPRQKFLDRAAEVVVVRTDQFAYQEEQFKQMAYLPPHPVVPGQPAYGQPPPQQPYGQPPPAQAPPPQQPPPQQQWPEPQQQPPSEGAWPGQEPKPAGSGWPQQTPGEAPKRFCQACGGPLTQRGDGKMTCTRCGAVY